MTQGTLEESSNNGLRRPPEARSCLVSNLDEASPLPSQDSLNLYLEESCNQSTSTTIDSSFAVDTSSERLASTPLQSIENVPAPVSRIAKRCLEFQNRSCADDCPSSAKKSKQEVMLYILYNAFTYNICLMSTKFSLKSALDR